MSAALLATVARSLASKHFAVAEPTADPFPDGAVVADGDHLIVYRHVDAHLVIGPAMLSASKAGATKVSIMVGDDETAPVLARHAAQLAVAPDVFVVDGTDIAPVAPADTTSAIAPSMDDIEMAQAAYGAHDLETVVEAGIVRGELLGLEVSRVTDGIIQVGVGRFDREAGAMLRGTAVSTDALADALEQVAPHRTSTALPHPLNRIGRERWLRALAVADPTLIGLSEIAPVETVAERINLLDPFVAAAIGVDSDGATALAVFAAGLDTTALSHVADLVARHRPDRVVVAIPEADMLPALTRLYPLLALPTTVVGMSAPWPR